MFIDMLRTVYARPVELLALDEVICGYIRILRALRAPEECEHIITVLRSFQERYYPQLVEIQDQPAPDGGQQMLSFQVNGQELVVFSAAVMNYLNFWRNDTGMYHHSLIRNVLTFQRRYIDSMPSCPPVVCTCKICVRMRMKDAW